jgi:hypothetical protein
MKTGFSGGGGGAVLPVLLAVLATPAHADGQPDSHAPIGVMAEHTHTAGEVMISYRFMHMDMGGTRIGGNSIDPDTIATSFPNRFFGLPGQPPTLRAVPLKMNTDMHMLGVMFAPADWVTLMAMGRYVSKSMAHRTYQGGMGANVLGGFTTAPDGFGDTSLAAIFSISKTHDFEFNIKAGVSIPTGSTTRTSQVLTPMNMQPTLRLPYAMQLGSGTWDLQPGATVMKRSGEWGWGAQYAGTIRTGTNGEGYRLGDSHMATAWVSRRLAPWISTSLRVSGRTTGAIQGIDPLIVAPVQTADPANYGGERLDLHLGTNLIGLEGGLEGYRLGIELGVPVVQNLNGPQMEGDWVLTVGVQKAF